MIKEWIENLMILFVIWIFEGKFYIMLLLFLKRVIINEIFFSLNIIFCGYYCYWYVYVY